MAYDAAVLRRAVRRLEEEKAARQEKTEALRKTLYAQIPELSDIDRQLRGTVVDIITSCLKKGTDPGPALRVIKDKNMGLQLRQAQLLQEAGYPPTPWRIRPAASSVRIRAGSAPRCVNVSRPAAPRSR